MKTNKETHFAYLGKPRPLMEGAEKVTGNARYVADLKLPGMLHARPVLSPYAHARILSVDKVAAEAMPGVVAVLLAEDLPTRNKTIASRNSAILAKEKVLWRGQPVVLVVAETDAIAADAADRVHVDYEPLPVAIDLLQAMEPGAPLVWPSGLPTADSDLSAAHANVEQEEDIGEPLPSNVFEKSHRGWGDVSQGFAQSDVTFEMTYRTSLVHQAYMEPHAVVAEPDPLGRSLTLHTSTQGAYMVRDEVAKLLDLPVSKVRVVPMTFGGGFGAKYGIVEPLAGAAAMALRRPVRLVLSRSEDFATTTPAHGSVIKLKTGASGDGSLRAIQAEIILDNGVFSFNIGGIAAALIGGYYKCPHVSIDIYEVITHKPQAGAYRAPSAPQITFALESNMDEMARMLALDPLEFRFQNAVETGDPMGNGNPWPEIGLKDVLDSLRAHEAWQKRATLPGEGVGIAIGGWPSFMGPASAICKVDADGTVILQSGAVDISGVNSAFVLVAAEVLGVSPEQVTVITSDTQMGPYAPNSGGSQVTYSVAGAVANAAGEAKRKLQSIAADAFEASPEDIELVDGHAIVRGVPDRRISLGDLVEIGQSRKGGVGPVVGEGNNAVPENAPGFVVHLAKVRVDPDTAEITLVQYVAIQDVGFALNPMMVAGQIHGGAAQGIGFGLQEAMRYDDAGQLLSGTFMDYGLPRSDTVPPIETILVEHPSPHGPFGARGIAEPPIVPGAAAIANAIRDATGVRLTELPMRSEDLWRAQRTS